MLHIQSDLPSERDLSSGKLNYKLNGVKKLPKKKNANNYSQACRTETEGRARGAGKKGFLKTRYW